MSRPDLHDEIDRSIASRLRDATAREPIPAGLTQRIDGAITRRRVARQRLVGGIAIAAVITIAGGLAIRFSPTPRSTPRDHVAIAETRPAPVTTAARVDAGRAYIVEEIETSRPDVTFVRLHRAANVDLPTRDTIERNGT